MTRTRLLTALAVFALAGCKDEGIRRYQVAKEALPVAPPASHAYEDHDHEGHAHEGEALLGLKWTLPAGWKEAKGEGMRYATLQAPGTQDLDISVIVLGGAAGGEVPNVNRWRQQMQLPEWREAEVARARRRIASKAGTLSAWDFEKDGDRMVVALLADPKGQTWFLKMKGKGPAVAAALPGFNRLLGSLTLG